MIKSVKVLNNAGMPVEKLYIEVEGNSFVSTRNGDLELKAQNPDSVVRINYLGSPEVRTTFGEIGDKIVVDNGFKKTTCQNSEVSMDFLSKEIQLVDKSGNPLIGISVFSESGTTNTTTDQNGMATVKVNDEEEYLNFDADHIEGQAIAFRSLPDQLQVEGFIQTEDPYKYTSKANGWLWGLLGLGLLLSHARNQSKSSSKKESGLGCPVKITL